MRYITPTLDHMYYSLPLLTSSAYIARFMDSLQWVDQTYVRKHKSEDPNTLRAMYYPNLRMYSAHGETSQHRAPMDAALAFLIRFGRRAGISLAIYMLSYLPVVGRFVLPAASFYTFNKAVGPVPATIIFGSGIFLPRRYLIIFLQSYFASRSLMRELVSKPLPRPPSPLTLSLLTRHPTARTILLTRTVHRRPKTALVSRSRGPAFRLRRRLLHLPKDPAFGCVDLRHCGGVHRLPDHEDNRSATEPRIQ